MFGGKKLKDLTEEDIRRYAASLAAGASPHGSSAEAGDSESQGQGPEPGRGVAAPAPEGVNGSGPSSAVEAVDSRKMAEAIAGRSVESAGGQEQASSAKVGEKSAGALVVPTRDGVEEPVQRSREEERAEEEAQQDEEERLRLEVLAELERSQMPAVHTEDGVIVKTIEHYTFADTAEVATISVELDKDLFDGAATFVEEGSVEVTTLESSLTLLLHSMPAGKGVSTPADWQLVLDPLLHSVEPGETKWKLRKGKISVKLRKRKPQEWRRVLKF